MHRLARLLLLYIGPLFTAIYGLFLLLTVAPGEFSDLAGAMLLLVAFIAVVVCLIINSIEMWAVKKDLPWWGALLCSALSVAIAFGILTLTARLTS